MIIDDLYNKKSITESQLNEVDPRNFDSDVDYYAALRAQGRPKYSSDWDEEDERASREAQARYDAKQRMLAVQKAQAERKTDKLDEISLDQIGRGVGKALGGVGRTVGAVAGVPQGIGRAVKQGYRSAVQNIGGAGNATPVASSEVPTATGMINPATGRAYVPSDFGDEQPATATTPKAKRTAADVQQDIRNLDTQYKQQMRQLQSELSVSQSQPAGDDFTQAQKDYMAAIGLDQPKRTKTPATAQDIANRRIRKQKAATKALNKPAAPQWKGRPAVAAPAVAMSESLTWSKDWDPSETLLRKLH